MGIIRSSILALIQDPESQAPQSLPSIDAASVTDSNPAILEPDPVYLSQVIAGDIKSSPHLMSFSQSLREGHSAAASQSFIYWYNDVLDRAQLDHLILDPSNNLHRRLVANAFEHVRLSSKQNNLPQNTLRFLQDLGFMEGVYQSEELYAFWSRSRQINIAKFKSLCSLVNVRAEFEEVRTAYQNLLWETEILPQEARETLRMRFAEIYQDTLYQSSIVELEARTGERPKGNWNQLKLKAGMAADVSDEKINQFIAAWRRQAYSSEQIGALLNEAVGEWGIQTRRGNALYQEINHAAVLELFTELKKVELKIEPKLSSQGAQAIIQLRDFFSDLLGSPLLGKGEKIRLSNLLKQLEKIEAKHFNTGSIENLRLSLRQAVKTLELKTVSGEALSPLELLASGDSYGLEQKFTPEFAPVVKNSAVNTLRWFYDTESLMEAADSFDDEKIQKALISLDEPDEYTITLRRFFDSTTKIIKQAYLDSHREPPPFEVIEKNLIYASQQISYRQRSYFESALADYLSVAENLVRETIRSIEISHRLVDIITEVGLTPSEQELLFASVQSRAGASGSFPQKVNRKGLLNIITKYGDRLSAQNQSILRALADSVDAYDAASLYQRLLGIKPVSVKPETTVTTSTSFSSEKLTMSSSIDTSAPSLQVTAEENLKVNTSVPPSGLSLGMRSFIGSLGILSLVSVPSMVEEAKLLAQNPELPARTQYVAQSRSWFAGLTGTLSLWMASGLRGAQSSWLSNGLAGLGLFFSAVEGEHQYNLSASQDKTVSKTVRERYSFSDKFYATIKGLSGAAGYGLSLFGAGFLKGLLATTPSGWAVLGIGFVGGTLFYGVGDYAGRKNRKRAWADDVVEKFKPFFDHPQLPLSREALIHLEECLGNNQSKPYVDEEAVFYLLTKLKEKDLLSKVDWKNSPAFSRLRDRCYEGLLAESEASFEWFGNEGASALIYFGMQSPDRNRQKEAYDLYLSEVGDSEGPLQAFFRKYEIPEHQKFQLAVPALEDFLTTLTGE